MIVLTGTTGGIGKELVTHLLEIDHVIGTYNKSRPPNPLNGRSSYEKLNIEDYDEIRNFVKKCEPRLSQLTLIHGAAFNIDGLTVNYKEIDWDQVMGVNLKGNFLLTQALLPYMIKERFGRIIHISSIVGIEGAPGTIAYSTSKTGLLGMSRVLSKEYARFNVTSNVLVLGFFKTGMFMKLRDDHKEKIRNQIPSKTFGKVSNIANAIQFLIKSEYVNGAVINIDGGM